MKTRLFLKILGLYTTNAFLSSVFAKKRRKKPEPEPIVEVDTVKTVSGNNYFIETKEDEKFLKITHPSGYVGYTSLDDKIIDIPLGDTYGEHSLAVDNCKKKKSKNGYNIKTYLSTEESIKILYFWATFCGPCVDSLPKLKNYENELNKYKEQFLKNCSKELPKVRMVALNVDKEDRYEKAKKFAGDNLHKLPFPYFTVRVWSEKFDKLLYPTGHRPLPNFVLVDEENHIRKITHPDYHNYKSVPDFMQVEILRPYFKHICKK